MYDYRLVIWHMFYFSIARVSMTQELSETSDGDGDATWEKQNLMSMGSCQPAPDEQEPTKMAIGVWGSDDVRPFCSPKLLLGDGRFFP